VQVYSVASELTCCRVCKSTVEIYIPTGGKDPMEAQFIGSGWLTPVSNSSLCESWRGAEHCHHHNRQQQ
jgi:hypothetical protein